MSDGIYRGLTMGEGTTMTQDNPTLAEAPPSSAPQAEVDADPVADGKTFPVMEVFGPTLQGEGIMAGYQTMFIRFGGCDMRCKMCDSLHAVLPKLIKQHGKRQTAQEIFDELTSKARHCKVVTLSGGNPCVWDLAPLVDLLIAAGWRIAVETQGTIFQDWLCRCEWVTVSPKGPGMGEKFEEDKFQLFGGRLGQYRNRFLKVAIKVVLFDQQDIEFAKHIKSLTNGLPFYLSVGNPVPPDNPNSIYKGRPLAREELNAILLGRMNVLFEDILNEPDLVDAIFLPQLHVLLWGNERGR